MVVPEELCIDTAVESNISVVIKSGSILLKLKMKV